MSTYVRTCMVNGFHLEKIFVCGVYLHRLLLPTLNEGYFATCTSFGSNHPVIRDQIRRVSSNTCQYSLGAVETNNSSGALGFIDHQAKLSMTDTECEKSSKCVVNVGPDERIRWVRWSQSGEITCWLR